MTWPVLKLLRISSIGIIVIAGLGLNHFAWGAQDAIPKVLIIQNTSHPLGGDSSGTKSSKKDSKKGTGTETDSLDKDPDISEPLAEALAGNGKVEPIVWSTADPLFRAAYQSNKVQWAGGNVTLDQALAGARALGCKAVVFAYSQKGEASGQRGIYFRAEMYAGSKNIWVFPPADQFGGNSVGPLRTLVLVPNKKKPGGEQTYTKKYQTLTPKLTDKQKAQIDLSNWMFISQSAGARVDDDTAIQSIASTLTSSLSQGPLLGLKVIPSLTEQPMNPGIDKLISPQVPAPDPVSDDTLSQNLAGLLKAQSNDEALSLAYQAVDENPLDPRRREILLQTLNSLGHTSAAIDEAKSAAAAFGNSAPLLAVGSQIAFDGGEVDEAESMAMKALAIDLKSQVAQVVLGEVALYKGDLTSGYLSEGPFTTEKAGLQKWVNFALVAAMKGDTAWLNTNLGSHLASLPPEVQQRLTVLLRVEYHRKASAFRLQLTQCTVADATALAALSAELKSSSAQISSEGLLAQSLSTAFPDQKSLLRSQLAFNLLHQCVQEVTTYIAGGRKGTLDDPQINFSESLHQMNLAEREEESDSSPGTSPTSASPES